MDPGHECIVENSDAVRSQEEDTAVVFHASEENYHVMTQD